MEAIMIATLPSTCVGMTQKAETTLSPRLACRASTCLSSRTYRSLSADVRSVCLYSSAPGAIRARKSLRLCSGGVFGTNERPKLSFSVSAVSGEADLPAGTDVEESEKLTELTRTIQLGSLFGLWYLFNIWFNIYNKQVLKAFPFPITITTLQFLTGSVIASFVWVAGLHKRPQISKAQLLAIVPLACVHTLGNLFTNMSLGKVAVSFTHTIKALEPFFSVLLSSLFLGETPTLTVVLSLVPIVAGVSLASATEASFNWAGFLSAMASNVTFQSRNVLSKKLMVKKDASATLDNINLFSIITIMSLFLLSPAMLLLDGVKFTPAYLASKGLPAEKIMRFALYSGLCFHAYQQVSYMILQRVSPVTHSVGNCVKRVIVIVTSVLFFKTPVSIINGIGTGIALAGVFGYSQVKALKAKSK
eukprot:TRINITY_DN10552_c0_g1_i1.p1 TRINITY_DN10552_c0_g1~~TRINITY_DN10552_c0_g1_i1.p1  ORF type:complete len:418 (+),score=75.61 TRINITY_DN10552_c0_g1_i1:193-1446(+)